MAACKSHEQRTIPVNYEALKAPSQEQKPKEPLTISELMLNTFGGICFLVVANFIFQEAVKYIRELGQ